MGRKKRPFYRLIVSDSRNRRDGAYLANLGYYDPFAEPYEAKLDEDEILAWLRKGATMSETARSLVQREGILYRWDLERKGVDDGEIAAKVAIWRDDFSNRADAKAQAKADAARAVAKAAEAEKKAAEEEARKAAEAEAAAEAKAKAEAEAETETEEPVAEAAAEEPAEDTEPAAEAAEGGEADEAKDEG